MHTEGEVTIKDGDQTYTGSYTVTSGKNPMVTISSQYGTKTAQVGGSTPEGMARIMLSELVREAKD